MTLVEQTVCAALMLLVAGFGASFLSMTGRIAASACGRSDGIESVVIAAETLRRDGARLIFRETSDLVIGADGRTVAMLVAKDALDADLWSADGTAVSYRLVPAPAPAGAFQLERTDANGPRILQGCLLADLEVRLAKRGEVSERGTFLDVTLCAMSPGNGSAGFATRILIPVTPVRPPVHGRVS